MENKMSFYKKIFMLLVAIGLASTTVYAQEEDFDEHNRDLNERDLQALRDFLRERREQLGAEQQNPLKITGDVRMEYRYRSERFHGRELFGENRFTCEGLPISHNDFDIEANMRINYIGKRTWAEVHLQYDNSAGISDNDCCCDPLMIHEEKENCKECRERHGSDSDICESCEDARVAESFCTKDRFHGSGRGNELSLKRAYFGYTICESETTSLDVEIGRRKLYDVFESDIQYLSRFDGVVLRYSSALENVFDWYVKGAAFVVDERVNHYAWGAEVAFQNIYNSNFDFKYSIVDWEKRGHNRCGNRNPVGFKYVNSQFLVDYNVDPKMFDRPVQIYGAIVVNHDANQIRHVQNRFCKECFEDTFDVELSSSSSDGSSELVSGSGSESSDTSYSGSSYSYDGKKSHKRHHAWDGLGGYCGIYIGRVKKKGDWSVELEYQYVQKNCIAFDDQSGITLNNEFEGCCDSPLPTRDYQGVSLELLYAITDNFSIDTVLQTASSLGGARHRYNELKIEAVYAY
jgi:hypothetical protein